MTRELHLSAMRARYAHEHCLTDAEREKHIALETARIMGDGAGAKGLVTASNIVVGSERESSSSPTKITSEPERDSQKVVPSKGECRANQRPDVEVPSSPTNTINRAQRVGICERTDAWRVK